MTLAKRIGWLLSVAVISGAMISGSAAQEPERLKRYTIWDIHLGEMASAIPDQYVNFACGTNGGPPSLPLRSFAAFQKCKPDDKGLHEVYFEYDDELEYVARALENRAEMRMYDGTTVFEFPVVASLLFDDSGRVRGERIVTDPRQQTSRDRAEFWELGNFIRQHYGEDGWTCRDLPPDDGEGPAGTRLLKTHCEKTVSGDRLFVDQRFLQKKGQVFMNPQTGKAQPDAFESLTRFEIYDAGILQK